jgi:rsbT co-antagonist protein RsbR
MRTDLEQKIPDVLNDSDLIDVWMKYQMEALKGKEELISERALRATSMDFLHAFREGCQSASWDTTKPEWQKARAILADISKQRAAQGFTPVETAAFVFSLKQPIFERLSEIFSKNTAELGDSIWSVTTVLDRLGLYTTEVYQKSREELIRRQQKDILEMSTPVIKLWDGILAVPLIGSLDSTRTQTITEALLQEIMVTGSRIAILDITGVPTVDTQTAQHLIKTVSAARLMGADCIISGIRPQIAQTIVHLGIDIFDISTKATMADAIREALYRSGLRITQDRAPVEGANQTKDY